MMHEAVWITFGHLGFFHLFTFLPLVRKEIDTMVNMQLDASGKVPHLWS